MPHRARPPRAAAHLRSPRWRAAALLSVGLWLGGCGGAHDPATAGVEAYERGDYPAAVIHFKGAVQSRPGDSDVRLRLADALERTGDLVGMEQQLRQALEREADENVIVPRLALVMLDRNDFDRLVREFGSKRLRDPQADSTLRGAVALALMSRGQAAQARAAIDGVAESPAVVLARAQLLVADGKVKEALALLDPMKDAPGTPWWVLRATARVAMGAGDTARAVALLQKAHAQAPWQRGVTGEYGEALVTANRVDEAAALRDQLRQQAPRHFWTHYLDALLQTRAGRSEEAHAAALRVLSVAPDHVPSILLAAAAELRKGDLLMADKRLTALVRQQPNLLPAVRMLAQVQLRTGRTADAAATVRRGLVLAPDDPQLLAEKADAEVAAGQTRQAAATLAHLVAVRPQDGDALMRLAEVRHAAGDKAAAAPMLERAAALAKADAAQQARIVAAALRQGEVAVARRIADAAVAAQPQEPQARLSLAAVQSAQGDRAGAWSSTLAVLDGHPAVPGALSALSAMSRTPEQRRELARRYASAVEARAGSAQVYLDYAALLRFEPAAAQTTPLEVLQKGLTVVPGAVGLRGALVDELLRAGETDKALAVAQAGATMAGAPAEAVALLAAVYERLGKTPQAFDTYRKLAADYPQRADWRIKLAQYEAPQRPTEAVAILRALINERPFDPTPYLALAQLTSRTDPSGALSIARQMGQRADFQSAALLLEGELLAQAGRTDDALVQFSKADKAGAGPQATLRTVRLLDQAGRAPVADQQLADAMRRFPANPQVVGLAAQRAQSSGNPARAVELLQALADKAPDDAFLRNDLAWAQVAAGKPEALGNARRATAALPNNAVAMHTLGLALAQAGKRDDAIAALQAAANLAPTMALPRVHLAQQLLAAGNRPAALNALRGADLAQLSGKERAVADQLKTELTGS